MPSPFGLGLLWLRREADVACAVAAADDAGAYAVVLKVDRRCACGPRMLHQQVPLLLRDALGMARDTSDQNNALVLRDAAIACRKVVIPVNADALGIGPLAGERDLRRLHGGVGCYRRPLQIVGFGFRQRKALGCGRCYDQRVVLLGGVLVHLLLLLCHAVTP